MKKLCILLALGLGFAYFYPMRHESAPTACAALDQRIGVLFADQLKALPQGAAQHIRGIATGYVHDRFPLLPQQAGCVVAYWGTTLKPDAARSVIASYMATPLGSAGIRRSD